MSRKSLKFVIILSRQPHSTAENSCRHIGSIGDADRRLSNRSDGGGHASSSVAYHRLSCLGMDGGSDSMVLNTRTDRQLETCFIVCL
jgi:hypothetical protein